MGGGDAVSVHGEGQEDDCGKEEGGERVKRDAAHRSADVGATGQF